MPYLSAVGGIAGRGDGRCARPPDRRTEGWLGLPLAILGVCGRGPALGDHFDRASLVLVEPLVDPAGGGTDPAATPPKPSKEQTGDDEGQEPDRQTQECEGHRVP